jgi:hypothetical protein
MIRVYVPDIYAGIDQNETQPELVCYPNPVHSIVNLMVSDVYSDSEFIVIDCNGNMVLQGRMNGSLSRVDLGQLPTGLYQVKLNTSSRISYSVIKL